MLINNDTDARMHFRSRSKNPRSDILNLSTEWYHLPRESNSHPLPLPVLPGRRVVFIQYSNSKKNVCHLWALLRWGSKIHEPTSLIFNMAALLSENYWPVIVISREPKWEISEACSVSTIDFWIKNEHDAYRWCDHPYVINIIRYLFLY